MSFVNLYAGRYFVPDVQLRVRTSAHPQGLDEETKEILWDAHSAFLDQIKIHKVTDLVFWYVPLSALLNGWFIRAAHLTTACFRKGLHDSNDPCHSTVHAYSADGKHVFGIHLGDTWASMILNRREDREVDHLSRFHHRKL